VRLIKNVISRCRLFPPGRSPQIIIVWANGRAGIVIPSTEGVQGGHTYIHSVSDFLMLTSLGVLR
jgi:hypothetical protein